jgi:hypothetical protein
MMGVNPVIGVAVPFAGDPSGPIDGTPTAGPVPRALVVMGTPVVAPPTSPTTINPGH